MGTLTFCTPSFYSRSTLSASSPSWVPPNLTTDSNGDGLRITNTDGSLIDISSSNCTITTMAGIFGQPGEMPHYTSYLSANISVCNGYVSWAINNVLDPSSSAISTTPLLQPPLDIACINQPFDLDTWMSTPNTEFVLELLQGLSWRSDDLAKKAMDIILSTIDHTSSIAQLDITSPPPPPSETHPDFNTTFTANTTSAASSTPTPTNYLLPPLCTLLSKSSTTSSPETAQHWVLSGYVSFGATGQTLLGTALQCLITALSILTIALLFTPGLPLVTEWSAQWLGLVYGLSLPRVQECVEGTSAGGNFARGAGEEVDIATRGVIKEDGGEVFVDGASEGRLGEEEKRREELSVYLGSAGGDGAEGNPYLVLGLEKGRVRRGWGHV